MFHQLSVGVSVAQLMFVYVIKLHFISGKFGNLNKICNKDCIHFESNSVVHTCTIAFSNVIKLWNYSPLTVVVLLLLFTVFNFLSSTVNLCVIFAKFIQNALYLAVNKSLINYFFFVLEWNSRKTHHTKKFTRLTRLDGKNNRSIIFYYVIWILQVNHSTEINQMWKCNRK